MGKGTVGVAGPAAGRALRLVGALLLAVAAMSTQAAPTARAQDLGFTIRSSTPRSAPDGRTIGREFLCECYSTEDRITVLRTEGTAPISAGLTEETDFDGALWIFDVGGQGRNQLVVDFHRLDGRLLADVYQDQDADRTVAVGERDGRTVVTEPGFWSIRTEAPDGYWQREGRLAPNFDLTIDERLIATFGGELIEQQLVNDGAPDVVIRVRGPRGDDPRSYDWRNVVSPGITPSWGIYRTNLTVRERGEEPAFDPVFPWYLLGGTYGNLAEYRDEGGTESLFSSQGRAFGLVKPYGESFPPIQVIWNTFRPKIGVVGEFVASRGSEDNWFTYSIKRIEPGALTAPDFESPFAFYDMAEDDDTYPELSVRLARFAGNGPFGYVRELGRGYQSVRYSWDQANERAWTYKLSLVSEHDIEDVVPFPEFELETIPYEQLPTWVTGRPWDMATLVVAESDATWTTEGMYEGDHGLGDLYYFAGLRDEMEASAERRVGNRVETTPHLGGKLELTFNPVDRQLHLLGAEDGRWQIDELREVRYLSSAGGATFDGWQLRDGGQLVAQLYRVPGGLLYSDGRGTFFRAVELPDETFRTAPPASHDEWVALRERLAAAERPGAPGDLRALFDRFPGAPRRLAASPLADFRRTDDGVRFTVAAGEPGGDSLVDAEPRRGPQVVALVGGEWRIEHATFETPTVALSINEARALEGATIRVSVDNPGSVDLQDAYVRTSLLRADGSRIVLDRREVTVAGLDATAFDVEWLPTEARDWEIEAAVYRQPHDAYVAARNGEDVLLGSGVATFDVAAAPVVTERRLAAIGWAGAPGGRLLVLLGLAIAAAGAGVLGLRAPRAAA